MTKVLIVDVHAEMYRDALRAKFPDLQFTLFHSKHEVTGDLAIPLAAGVIRKSDIRADLFELARGDHPGRQSRQEITLFKNGGGGHLDLMTAIAAYERARPGTAASNASV